MTSPRQPTSDIDAQIAAVEKEIARLNQCLMTSDADELYAARFEQKKKLSRLQAASPNAPDAGGVDAI